MFKDSHPLEVPEFRHVDKWFVLILLWIVVAFAGADTGNIQGEVVSKKTRQPLVGANVVIDGSDKGAASVRHTEFGTRKPQYHHSLPWISNRQEIEYHRQSKTNGRTANRDGRRHSAE